MHNSKTPQWVLRIAVAGEFVGHGTLALLGNAQWAGWIQNAIGGNLAAATQLLFLIGLFDYVVALFILFKPIRVILLWAIFWGFFTALLRPIEGLSVWDFIERWANWGAPLALLLLIGWPKKPKDWFE
ncbi:MAG: hypothetical protein QOG91_409 [Candidatus Parcubacteria bacterium]|jgi:hypothetical protein|nr:hypothetical protein [Candidatus Parcubacteria bacterium]